MNKHSVLLALMKRYLLLILIGLTLSCNKAFDSKWDIDVIIPLVYTELDISDFVADSLISINSDETISLSLSDQSLKIDLDTLGTIQEISTVEKFLAPFVSFDYEPGSTFPTELEETELDVGSAELKQINIKSGRLGLRIQNYIEESLLSQFNVLSATLNGVEFAIEELIPPGNGNIPGEFYQEYDISGYELDLSGEDGTDVNTIVSNLGVIIDPDGNTVTVTNMDTLIIEVYYLELETAYARGSFGSEVIELFDEEESFSLLDNIAPGSIDFENIEIKLDLINGVGADFRLRLEELKSVNSAFNSEVLLDHEIIGNTINVDRAVDDPVLSFYRDEYLLNADNSNVEEWIENFPDKIGYSLFAEMNPLGNVSGGNDFIYCESELGFIIEAEIPLCLSIEQLMLSDTLEISFDDEDNIDQVQSGNLEILVKNSFPLEGDVQLYLIENNLRTDSLLTTTELAAFGAPLIVANSSVNSILTLPVSSEKFDKLKSADFIEVIAKLNSPNNEQVKLKSGQKIELVATLKANYLIDNE